MLVLSRKVGERIQIGDDVQLVVLKSAGGRIKLGIDAPRDVAIQRHEILFREPAAAKDASLDQDCSASAA